MKRRDTLFGNLWRNQNRLEPFEEMGNEVALFVFRDMEKRFIWEMKNSHLAARFLRP